MFRDMRREKKGISLQQVKDLLTKERRGILAVNGDDGYPYAIPVNYLYDEENQRILFHGARSGHKVDALKKDDKVCFTVYGHETIKQEEWAPFFQSAVIFGKCHLIENQDENIILIKQFAQKYYPNEKMIDEQIIIYQKAIQMFEIKIEHLSGKEVQER